MSLTHYEALKTIDTTYRRNHGLKVQNNTRLYMRGDAMTCEFGVVLHGTEVVTLHSDGSYTLNSGGYRTVTTLDRIRRWGPPGHNLFSEHSEWFVRLKPNPKDPHPTRFERSIPKPYDAKDPGPEPVKSPEGCIAGRAEIHPVLASDYHYDWREADPNATIYDKWYEEDPFDGMFSASAYQPKRPGYTSEPGKRTLKLIEVGHYYGEHGGQWGDRDEGWAEFTHQTGYDIKQTSTDAAGVQWKYRQCPHCKAFDAVHAAWTTKMQGDRWGERRFDHNTGYVKYAAMMEQFGSKEAWQEAYIADFRARRDYTKACREWEIRNRVPFYDGIVVDSEGYAPRLRANGPSPAKLRRHEATVKRVKRRIKTYVDAYIAKLGDGMPMPGNGDCWYCLMHTSDGTAMGDLAPEAGDRHLNSHMMERYYVPMLAVNAMRETKITDIGVGLLLDMNPDSGKMGGRGVKAYSQVHRALTKYMQRRLVPEPPTS